MPVAPALLLRRRAGRWAEVPLSAGVPGSPAQTQPLARGAERDGWQRTDDRSAAVATAALDKLCDLRLSGYRPMPHQDTQSHSRL